MEHYYKKNRMSEESRFIFKRVVYHEQYPTLEMRLQKNRHIRSTKGPNIVPVLVYHLDGKRIVREGRTLVATSVTFPYLIEKIRKHLTLPADQGFTFWSGRLSGASNASALATLELKTLLGSSILMQELEREEVDADGFVRIMVLQDSTFG